MIITRALLCTVHKSKSQHDVQIYGVSPPPSHCTGSRAPSSQEEWQQSSSTSPVIQHFSDAWTTVNNEAGNQQGYTTHC